jgi:hypothetical protein
MSEMFDPSTRVVNRRREKESLYIGRGTIWGNPFTSIQDRKTKAEFVVKTREQSVELYENYLLTQPTLLYRLPELNGHQLGCFCKPLSCHGDILVRHLKGMLLLRAEFAMPDLAIDWSDPQKIEDLIRYSHLASQMRY